MKDSFEKAFASHVSSCSGTCECGKIFYNPDNGWSWNDNELEEFENNPEAIPLDYAVPFIMIEGREYVMVCDCWHKRADEIIEFIDSYAIQIADYLTFEKQRKQREADASPVVKEAS